MPVPAYLEEGVLIVNVHGTTSALAGPVFLREQLCHDFPRRHTARQGVAVLSVVGVFDVRLADRVGYEGRDTLLPVIQVHETTDVALCAPQEPPQVNRTAGWCQ